SWANVIARRAAIAEAVGAALADEPADVVVTQRQSAPAAIAAAGGPSLLLLPNYESLCRYAFDAGSACGATRDCVRCPRARALPDAEATRLRVARTESDRALASATVLLAPSEAVAAAVERWCGRRPDVVPPVSGAPDLAHPPRAGGHVLLAAETWSANEGADLLAPLVAALPDREFVITPLGLDDDARRAVGAAGNVWFLEAPIERVLDGASVCLVPSRWAQPFGRIAFEAQATGVPVLASAVGGLVEVVPEEALLAPEATPKRWAAAVRALEPVDAWRAASYRAHAAAEAMLATRPLERAIGVVEAAAAG
ncbi:MAG TPA: glycosyltransferase, partial [Solirubrobacteraceae bacterium]|nr:glycosyltransferase [Solirubrobacteraceae bacterium]